MANERDTPKLTADASRSIELELDGAVAVARLNDPAGRNALTDEMLTELADRLVELDQDDGVRCIVIAGSEKTFASGADIRALLRRNARQMYEGDRMEQWQTVREVKTPMIAAVSGYCLGGGCELAMTADIVIASETAKFGMPETGLGLIPGAGGTKMLPRAIGRAKAMDLILSGRLLSAEEAESAGLVSRVVQPDRWFEDARAVATEVASRPPLAQRLAREAVAASFDTPLDAALLSERRAFAMAFADPDAHEGLTAFLERREPQWAHETISTEEERSQ